DNLPEALAQDIDTGWMLYDVFDLASVNDSKAKPSISVFHAQVKQGVLDVPNYYSEAVKKSAGSRYFCESLFWASQPKQA
ncbi:hypothetical protein BMR02_14095, partial [Methylococcaceae bacterium HT1]